MLSVSVLALNTDVSFAGVFQDQSALVLPAGRPMSRDGGEQAELPERHRPGADGPGGDAAHEAAGPGLRSGCGLLRGEHGDRVIIRAAPYY